MANYVIIEAPSVLGLFPGGVEHLPEALLEAGLADVLGADHAGRVIARPYDSTRDPATGLLNPTGLRARGHHPQSALDSDGGITRALVACVVRALDRTAAARP